MLACCALSQSNLSVHVLCNSFPRDISFTKQILLFLSLEHCSHPITFIKLFVYYMQQGNFAILIHINQHPVISPRRSGNPSGELLLLSRTPFIRFFLRRSLIHFFQSTSQPPKSLRIPPFYPPFSLTLSLRLPFDFHSFTLAQCIHYSYTFPLHPSFSARALLAK